MEFTSAAKAGSIRGCFDAGLKPYSTQWWDRVIKDVARLKALLQPDDGQDINGQGIRRLSPMLKPYSTRPVDEVMKHLCRQRGY